MIVISHESIDKAIDFVMQQPELNQERIDTLYSEQPELLGYIINFVQMAQEEGIAEVDAVYQYALVIWLAFKEQINLIPRVEFANIDQLEKRHLHLLEILNTQPETDEYENALSELNSNPQEHLVDFLFNELGESEEADEEDNKRQANNLMLTILVIMIKSLDHSVNSPSN